MEQLINVKHISSCGDNNLYTVYISRFYENLNYRRKYDPLFHFHYIFYISSSWVLILYKSIENWCFKQIKLTPWRCVHFDFVQNFQCSWRDFERTGVLMFCEHAVFRDTGLPTFRPICRSTNSPTDMFKAIYPSIFKGKLDLHRGICSRKCYFKP